MLRVTHETRALASVHIPLVTQGQTADGSGRVVSRDTAPFVPPRSKYANRERTLRAFMVRDDASGATRLFVETARPTTFYEVSGSFTPDAQRAPTWGGETRLMFVGTAFDGTLMRYAFDLRDLTLTALDLRRVVPLPRSLSVNPID